MNNILPWPKKPFDVSADYLQSKKDHNAARIQNTNFLIWTAIAWLGFFAVIITLIGFGILNFPPIIASSVIIGSLSMVFGLCKLSLDYFFERNNKK